MKKFKKQSFPARLAIMLCCVLLFTACSSNATAPSEPSDQNPTQAPEGTPSTPAIIESEGLAYRVNSDQKTCIITGIGTCKDTDLYIPQKIDGYDVTEIAESAFSNCSQLISVTVPNHVKKIGHWAFYQCNNLTTLSIPFVGAGNGSNAAINFEYIFGATGSNQSIDDRDHAPESLKTVIVTGSGFIHTGAFMQCRNITSITLTGTIIEIHDGAFSGCSGLTELILPDSVEEIRSQAFMGCNKLTQIKLPNSLKSLGNEAFRNCSRLTDIVVPKSVTAFGNSAFQNCTALKSFFYCGTAEEWNAIEKNDSTEIISAATVYYYSETQPTASGNYWRYVDDVPTAW